MYFLLTGSSLANEQYIVTTTINGKVACLCQSLKHAHLLCCHRHYLRTGHLTGNGNAIARHIDSHYGMLLIWEIGRYLLTDELLAFGLCHACNVQLAHNGKINIATIVNKIGEQCTRTAAQVATITKCILYWKIERTARFGYSKLVLRHNVGIVQPSRSGKTQSINILEVSDFLCWWTTVQQQDHHKQKYRKDYLLHIY